MATTKGGRNLVYSCKRFRLKNAEKARVIECVCLAARALHLRPLTLLSEALY